MKLPTVQKPRRSREPILLALLVTATDGLAERLDLDVTGGATAVYQQELDTQDDDASLSGDLRFKLAAGGGTWVLYVEGATGTDADSIFNT